MHAILLAAIAFVTVLAGLLLGFWLRNTVPSHHLSGDSRDAVKMASGLIGTLTALVLGLLVSSAKNSLDEMSDAITQSGARLIMLDRVLARYGSETQVIREQLRSSVAGFIAVIWPEHMMQVNDLTIFEESTPAVEAALIKLNDLSPQTDLQRAAHSEAQQICRELLQTRWLVIEQSQLSMPMAFVVVLLFWLMILFATIGLLAPTHKTVTAVLVICAISVAGAVFLIEEMNNPLSGMVKVSSAPLIKAVGYMGK